MKANAGRERLSRSYRPHSLQLLIARDADLTIRARVPRHRERPGEVLDVSGAEYCAIFPTLATNRRQELLRLIVECRIRALDISPDW